MVSRTPSVAEGGAAAAAATRPTGENRLLISLISLVIGCAAILLMHFTLPEGLSEPALGPPGSPPWTSFLRFPWTIQSLEWLVFFVGLGELWVRHRAGQAERAELDKGLLPEKPVFIDGKPHEVMLQIGRNLEQVYGRVRESPTLATRFLPRIIQRVIMQFQSSRSIDQANSLLNSSLELFLHEIDLRYSMLRYIMWVIPTLGFIGTVYGLAAALQKAANPDSSAAGLNVLGILTTDLGVAFYTTLLALVLSGILVFLIHVVQGREEAALNKVGQYCLDNLINRLYEK